MDLDLHFAPQLDWMIQDGLDETRDSASQRPRASPSPGLWRNIVEPAIKEARRHLRLPDHIHVIFVQGEGGSAIRTADGKYHIYLGVDAFPDRLRCTTFHEVMHIHDFHTGASSSMSKLIQERRAIAFAAHMTNGVGVW